MIKFKDCTILLNLLAEKFNSLNWNQNLFKSVKISAAGKYWNKNVCQQQFVKAILGYSSKIA